MFGRKDPTKEATLEALIRLNKKLEEEAINSEISIKTISEFQTKQEFSIKKLEAETHQLKRWCIVLKKEIILLKDGKKIGEK